ncbi:hypothetical protein [Rhizobium leguminosarum]|uniref:hypothetical protein n=1 Tax=Rhizobium leguminosarum TaxID=384 RepID=UPI0010388F02|nr:hypothetical protein [Rhizobium leguminosarum]MBB4326550.1 hypothetical protein [Rhizobium leguminosarum]MBB4352160.1 hypothetical protein [Rhizobium leguminosarum]MBB4546808.1 hypothetical protein [Rhizobium leguminosarum]MBB4559135.1 hypothetical protein [Rhizobium leguminosarum]TBZ57823.1 hypothetical protein E0H48_15230 [Rhizobium leguminosarum bv. viciae]
MADFGLQPSQLSRKLVAEISKTFDTTMAQLKTRSDPRALIEAFLAQNVAARGYLVPDDLVSIALLKNGGKLSEKTRVALASNSPEAIRLLTHAAYRSADDEIAARLLLGLDGVNLPTASCILAWVWPARWPVIDMNSWAAIEHFDSSKLAPKHDTTNLKMAHWLFYTQLIRPVGTATGLSPQQVDMWLYAIGRSLRKSQAQEA